MRLSQNFSFWESYLRCKRKSGLQAAFSEAFHKTNRVLGNAPPYIVIIHNIDDNCPDPPQREVRRIFHIPEDINQPLLSALIPCADLT
jgi:hypothetical protein